VLSGLQLGDEVILANYAIPVPASNTSTLGGFGGGGFGAPADSGAPAASAEAASGAGDSQVAADSEADAMVVG